MTTAIVVGSGPNGLTAAAVLARAGVSVTVIEGADTIGGGTRTSELIESDVWHDECSAVHPTAASSPAFRELGLLEHGLQWAFAEFDAGHPLDGGRAAVLSTSIEQTAAGLGRDGRAWSSFFAPLAKRVDRIIEEFFQPLLHVPRHPIDLGLFGAQVLPPATWNARRFADEATRALYAGITAHAIYPLGRVTSSAIGSMMIASGHRYGWPVAVGGSRSITDALASIVVEHGGRIETGRWVRSLRDLPAADIVMLDLSPQGAVSIAGDAMPASTAKAYGRWRYGPGAFKVDLVVDGPSRSRGPARCTSGEPLRRSRRRSAPCTAGSCRSARSCSSASSTSPIRRGRPARTIRSGPTRTRRMATRVT